MTAKQNNKMNLNKNIKNIYKWLFVIGLTLSSIGLLRIIYYQAKAEVAQIMIRSAWEKSNQASDLRNKKVKPWSWADTWPVMEIVFPELGTSNIVLKDISGESLAFGPGLMTKDILPGDVGNSFVAAHRDTHFKSIGRLMKNYSIEVKLQSGTMHTFIVDKIKVVDSRKQQPWTETEERRITLVTCYPFDGSIANTPFRYLVSGVLKEV